MNVDFKCNSLIPTSFISLSSLKFSELNIVGVVLLHLYGHYVFKKLLFCIWQFVVSTLLDRECVIYEKEKKNKRTFYMYYASDTCFRIMNIKSQKSMKIKEVSHDSSFLFLFFFFLFIYSSRKLTRFFGHGISNFVCVVLKILQSC